MIPTIGIIIGAYTILRSIELLCRAKEHFTSAGARRFVELCAIGMIVLSLTCMADLVLTGSRSTLGDLLTLTQSTTQEYRPTPPPKRTPAEEEKYQRELKELIRKAREQDR